MMKRIGYFVLGSLAGAVITSAVLHGAPSGVPDAVNVSPQFYTVRLENDRVRVLEYVLPAGQSEPLHSHHPGVAYVISGATLHTRMADGTAADGTLNTGDVHWRDKNVTHAVQNVGSTDLRALLIELK
jgi:quercetin dioxygenase-like cupin family protein